MQCLRCGYDLTGLAEDAGCPECGLAVAETREVRERLTLEQGFRIHTVPGTVRWLALSLLMTALLNPLFGLGLGITGSTLDFDPSRAQGFALAIVCGLLYLAEHVLWFVVLYRLMRVRALLLIVPHTALLTGFVLSAVLDHWDERMLLLLAGVCVVRAIGLGLIWARLSQILQSLHARGRLVLLRVFGVAGIGVTLLLGLFCLSLLGNGNDAAVVLAFSIPAMHLAALCGAIWAFTQIRWLRARLCLADSR